MMDNTSNSAVKKAPRKVVPAREAASSKSVPAKRPRRRPTPRQQPAGYAPKVRDVMTSTVVTASADTPLPALVDEMLHYGFAAIPVVEGGRLVGIVSEADLVSKPAYGGVARGPLAVLADMLMGRDRRWAMKSKARTAGEVMSSPVVTADPREDIRVAARRMVERQVKRLPVLSGGRLVGILSRSDVLRAMHRSDAELAGEVSNLLADPLRVPETALVSATVADGVVTLRGSVRFPIDLPVLSAMVWRFPGVVDVKNEVTARESDPQPWQPWDGF